MTREELKENICGMTYDDMFEYIYELESRTCESCRWYQEQYNDRNCKSDTIFVCKLYDIAHGKDFCCNKHEAKDK